MIMDYVNWKNVASYGNMRFWYELRKTGKMGPKNINVYENISQKRFQIYRKWGWPPPRPRHFSIDVIHMRRACGFISLWSRKWLCVGQKHANVIKLIITDHPWKLNEKKNIINYSKLLHYKKEKIALCSKAKCLKKNYSINFFVIRSL